MRALQSHKHPKEIIFFIGLLVLLSITVINCDKQDLLETTSTAEKEAQLANYLDTAAMNNFHLVGKPVMYELVDEGQNILGYLTVGNSIDSLFINYTVTNGDILNYTYLYVGKKENVSLDWDKNPDIYTFPYNNYHENTQSYTYRLLRPANDSVLYIFASALIARPDPVETFYTQTMVWSNSRTGVTVKPGDTSSVWTDGSTFKKTFGSNIWGGFSTYTIQTPTVPTDTTGTGGAGTDTTGTGGGTGTGGTDPGTGGTGTDTTGIGGGGTGGGTDTGDPGTGTGGSGGTGTDTTATGGTGTGTGNGTGTGGSAQCYGNETAWGFGISFKSLTGTSRWGWYISYKLNQTITVPFIAGKNNTVGSVEIYNDSEYLYIAVSTTGGVIMDLSHVFAGTMDNFKKCMNKAGTPVPGQFPYQQTINRINNTSFKIPLSTIGSDSGTVTIAVHAQALVPVACN